MINIAIFASGAGSNAAVIINTLHQYIPTCVANVKLILTNKKHAGVINIATQHNIACHYLDLYNKNDEQSAELYVSVCKANQIDFIVLAGYLKKIPSLLIKQYPERIINIHPALLPKYGGAGMYGKYVHEAVLAASEAQSGITIHFVDELYDHGKIIFQATCPINKADTADKLAEKIHQLEHQYFTKVISETIVSQNPVK